MPLTTVTEVLLVAYAVISAVLLIQIWRRDVYFAVFFAMIVVYSAFSQIGYYFVPELSIVKLQMYFGPEILPEATAFTILSLLAMYASFRIVYPYVFRLSIPVKTRPGAIGVYMGITATHLAVLLIGLIVYFENLNYANASDVDFIEAAGLPYKLFWNLFKFTTFSILVLFAVVKLGATGESKRFLCLRLMLIVKGFLFVIIAVLAGNRTDLLAVVVGGLGMNYFTNNYGLIQSSGVHAIATHPPNLLRGHTTLAKRVKRFAAFAFVVLCTLTFLTILEANRGGQTSNDSLEASTLTQAILLKDYYPPFHVLLGVMASDYVSPLAVLTSNAANALMFLKVDFLQMIAVDQWNPGSTTRAASPAFFAFTEGYMFMGWYGFVYNGLVLTLGLSLWRLLARTDNVRFNVVALSITLAMAATVARSQSSYFIKDVYLYFLPALGLYSLATGCHPRILFFRWRAPKRSDDITVLTKE